MVATGVRGLLWRAGLIYCPVGAGPQPYAVCSEAVLEFGNWPC